MIKVFGKQIHYAWVILLCCVLLAIGATGAMNSFRTNFITPVTQEFGCSVTAFTMAGSIEAITMALMYTTASRLLTTRRIGKVMFWAVALELVGIALMSVYPKIYFFYISGVMLGIGSAFSVFMAVPLVINMWFRKKSGLALGIYAAFMCAANVFYSLFSGRLIVSYGWRRAYLVLAIMGAVITLPALFFLMKSPEEIGIKPYGYSDADNVPEGAAKDLETETWGYTKEKALRMPLFYVVWGVCMLYSVGTCAPGFLAAFATKELGHSIPEGAFAFSVYSVGSVICSFMLGVINDRFGLKAGMLWGAVFNAAGMTCLICSTPQNNLLIPGAALVGIGCMGMYSVQAPLLAKNTMGNKHYSSIWSIMMTGNSMIAGIASPLLSMFYDKGGSFKGVFVLSMSFFIIALAVGIVAVNKAGKLRAAGAAE